MFKKIVLMMLLSVASAFAAEVNWADDFRDGITKAQAQNKPILFIYSRHTCKYCVILDEKTLKESKVVKALNRDFISIISYTDENDYTPRELLRPGTPTIWFLKEDGEPMYQPLMGAVDPENFLKALAIVKEEFDKSSK